jgi:hypothetical protein
MATHLHSGALRCFLRRYVEINGGAWPTLALAVAPLLAVYVWWPMVS